MRATPGKHVEDEGRDASLMAGDVKDPKFCEAAVRKVVKAFGRLDILVNNAAFQLHAERLEDISEEHLQETLQTNIGGYFHMARAALPHLGERRQHHQYRLGNGDLRQQAPARLFRDQGRDPRLHPVARQQPARARHPRERVAPGPVWTPLNPADKPAKDVAEFGQDSDMGRPAQPEEISPAYVFLASPVTASYVNGVVLPVMGGPRG